METSGSSTEIHDLVRKKLAQHDVRYTAGRKSVVAAIQMASGPRSAAELTESSKDDVPVSSLYRTLAVLGEAGVLRKHHGSNGIARYELAEWLTGHHHHVVCVACGAMEDIDVPDHAEHKLHVIAELLGRDAGYRVLDHVLEVEGVCPSCEEE